MAFKREGEQVDVLTVATTGCAPRVVKIDSGIGTITQLPPVSSAT
jgi:hypothetical protein